MGWNSCIWSRAPDPDLAGMHRLEAVLAYMPRLIEPVFPVSSRCGALMRYKFGRKRLGPAGVITRTRDCPPPHLSLAVAGVSHQRERHHQPRH